MRKLQLLLVSGLLMVNICFAAGNSRITLNDGTTIYGKVVGMNDGVYCIRTETMGDLNINSDNVVEISSNAAGNNSNGKKSMDIIDGSKRSNNNSNYNNYSNYSDNSDKSDLYSQQQQNANTRIQSMMMDENFMEKVMQLGNSSEMQSILNDEEVMNAIQSGDYDYLMNNSKMNDLMNSSGIQGLLGDM